MNYETRLFISLKLSHIINKTKHPSEGIPYIKVSIDNKFAVTLKLPKLRIFLTIYNLYCDQSLTPTLHVKSCRTFCNQSSSTTCEAVTMTQLAVLLRQTIRLYQQQTTVTLSI